MNIRLAHLTYTAAILLPMTSLLADIAPDDARLPYGFPIYDYPFNAAPGSLSTSNRSPVPSMAQSIGISKTFYQLSHQGLMELGKSIWPGTPFLQLASVFTFDLAAGFYHIPLGDAWVHEEWHRAVLGRRNMASFDDVYSAPPGASTINVSHVTDDDLRRLKRDHPAEFVRLPAAGMEAQTELNRALISDAFVFGTNPHRDQFLLWSNALNNIFYMQACASRQSDSITVEGNYMEGSRLDKRDFTGLDCNAWVYDLHRPDEPYDARGPHPFGQGIDRYIKYSNGTDSPEGAVLNYLQYGRPARHADLTRNEQDYLRSAARWSWVQVLSPAFVGFSKLRGPVGTEWNVNAQFYMTSFGTAVDVNGLFRVDGVSYALTVHSYHNAGMHLPGFEFRVIRYPAVVFGQRIFTGFTAAGWFQPEDQRFWATKKSRGGLLGAGLAVPFDAWEWFIEGDAKTPGWVAGNVYLDKALQIRTGAALRL